MLWCPQRTATLVSSRRFVARFLLPISLIVFDFLLAAVSPSVHSSALEPPVLHAPSQTGNLANPSRLARTSRRPPLLPLVAFVGTGAAVSLIIGTVGRMIVRRSNEPGKSHPAMQSNGLATDLLLIAVVALVLGALVIGLRTAVSADRNGVQQPVAGTGKEHSAQGTPSVGPRAPDLVSATRSGVPAPMAAALIAATVLLALSFPIVRRRDQRLHATSFGGPVRNTEAVSRTVEHGGGADIRGAYRGMCRLLEPFVTEKATQTPREYLRALGEAGISCREIEILTRSFEYERYAIAAGRENRGDMARTPEELLTSIRRFVVTMGERG